MQFVEWLRKIFLFLFPLGCISSLLQGFLQINKQQRTVTISESQNKKADVLLIVHNIACMLIIISGIFYLAIVKKWIWAYYLLIVPSLFQYAYKVFSSATVVGVLVRSSETKNLSFRDKTAIIFVSGVFWMSELQEGGSRLYEWVLAIENNNAYDLCLWGCHFYRMFTMTFFSFALSSIPAELIVIIAKRIGPKLIVYQEHLIHILQKVYDSPARKFLYIEKYISYLRRTKGILQIIMSCFIPAVILFDLVIGVIGFWGSILHSALLYLLLIIYGVGGVVFRPVIILGKNSNRKNIALSFRIAMILTLTTLVIINRIEPFFRNAESSTAIFEFLASAIIIPIVFEWINSVKSQTSSKC